MKTVMLGLGYQVSINADISCSFEGWLDFFLLHSQVARLPLLFDWGSGSC